LRESLIYDNGGVSSASVLSFLLERIQSLPGSLVYGLVALLVFGEAAFFIGFVLPGETAVIVAGVVASRGHVNVVLLCVLVVVAAIAGDSVGYAVGAQYGDRLLALKILRSRRESLDRALDALSRRGLTYVFIGRFTAFLRAVIPGLAGMSRLHYRRFLAANAAGALAWGVLYTLLGYFAGHALDSIEKYSGWAASGLLVLFVAVMVVVLLRHRRRTARDDATWRHDRPETDLPKSAE
jgi:membrane protein DedA with SNARE-associated domain